MRTKTKMPTNAKPAFATCTAPISVVLNALGRVNCAATKAVGMTFRCVSSAMTTPAVARDARSAQLISA